MYILNHKPYAILKVNNYAAVLRRRTSPPYFAAVLRRRTSSPYYDAVLCRCILTPYYDAVFQAEVGKNSENTTSTNWQASRSKLKMHLSRPLSVLGRFWVYFWLQHFLYYFQVLRLWHGTLTPGPNLGLPSPTIIIWSAIQIPYQVSSVIFMIAAQITSL